MVQHLIRNLAPHLIKLRRMSDPNNCILSAQRSLSLREHSEYEIRTKLRNKGYAESEINEAVAQLKNADMLSDNRYTSQYIRLRQNKGFGKSKIIYELKIKGISSDMINDNSDVFNDDYDILVKLYNKKFYKKNENDDKSRSKLYNYFMSRGFQASHIKKLLEDHG